MSSLHEIVAVMAFNLLQKPKTNNTSLDFNVTL